MTVTSAIQLLQGLLTPLIAIVAVYIAWQQLKTNRQKFTLDRYDRRFRVYDEARKFLSIVIRDADVGFPDILNFRRQVAEAEFLFGPEISQYIALVAKRAGKLHVWTSQYRDYTQPVPAGYDHQKVVEGIHDELDWFAKQFDVLNAKFKKHLYVGG